MFAPAYFDHNATTPIDAAVLEAMLPYLGSRFGNPSSRHDYGRLARVAVDEARMRVAAAVGAHPTEIIFTSGGSEANNLFLRGAVARLSPGILAVSSSEHASVLETARALAARSLPRWRLCEIAVDTDGGIDDADYARIMAQKPGLVSVMLANNETGALQDIARLATLARASGALFHSDAVQALGKVAIDFRALNDAGVNALTLSAHKINGPKGSGALVLDKRVELQAQITGGGQERDLRSGTENVAAIVGFGLACELANQRLATTAAHTAALQRELEAGLNDLGAKVFGSGAARLPNTTFFAFPQIDGETLVGKLDRAGFAVASGSACASASPEPSHVLSAMAVPAELARGAVRVSFGGNNTVAELRGFLTALAECTSRLRRLTALAGS